MRRFEAFLAIGVIAMAAGLVLSHRYLPMNDAPSHMATAVIASRLMAGDAFFAAHYALPPTPVPYWMTTLATWALLPALGPHHAFAAVVAVYVVLLPASFWFLRRTRGHSGELLVAVVGLAVFNRWYWKGETNFLLGQPLVLLAAAALLRAREERRGALVAFGALAVLTYLCHVFALTALLVVASCLVASDGMARRPLRIPLLAFAWVLLLFGMAAFVVLGSGGEHTEGRPELQLSPGRLRDVVVGPFESPTLGALPWVAPFVGAIAILVAGPALRERTRAALTEVLDPLLALPAVVLLLGSWLAPNRIVSAGGMVKEGELAERFVLLGFVLLLAAVRRPPSPRPLALALVCVFAVIKLADAARLHERFDDDAKEISRSVLAKIPVHQRLLCRKEVERADDLVDLYHRIGIYAVVEREAYSPHVFAVPGQQALRHLQAPARPLLSGSPITPWEWDWYDDLLLQTDGGGDAQRFGIPAREVARFRGFRLYALDGGP